MSAYEDREPQMLDPLEKQKLKEKREFEERRILRTNKIAKATEDFQNQFKNLDDFFTNEDGVKVPKILYLANKSEDGYEGDILGDFYHKFPNSALDQEMEPIFISAEHGDGF